MSKTMSKISKNFGLTSGHARYFGKYPRNIESKPE